MFLRYVLLMGTCKHRMGIHMTDLGPRCARTDCQVSMSLNCLFCATEDHSGRFCSGECESGWTG